MSAKYGFQQAVRELRFHLCQTSEASGPTRSFLLRSYPVMKKHNPSVPILIREAAGVEPKVWARYEFGQEKAVSLAGLDSQAIEQAVAGLVKAASP